MNKGSSRGWLAVLAAALCVSPKAQAQNLGLGTGSRGSAADSAQDARPGWNEEESAPRRSQMNKRLGLTARHGLPFDPKIYEARGRELQGQFYEIGDPADSRRKGQSADPFGNGKSSGSAEPAFRSRATAQWFVWAGVAGLAGASATAVGYLLMQKSHPTAPPPKDLVITDE